jgi:hypothetical protein
MNRPEAGALLQVWERCAGQSVTMRGLAMLSLAMPQAGPRELAEIPIGRRDGALLDLRAELFGKRLECVTDCARCGERIELGVPIERIRADAPTEMHFTVDAGERTLRFRLPHSADLLVIERLAVPADAERELVERCVSGNDLPLSAIEIVAIDRRMGEVDAQSEVLFDIACPQCSAAGRAVFDIVSHLWIELEAWARSMLREVHLLASSYGWNEGQILTLGSARRRAYLDLIDGG